MIPAEPHDHLHLRPRPRAGGRLRSARGRARSARRGRSARPGRRAQLGQRRLLRGRDLRHKRRALSTRPEPASALPSPPHAPAPRCAQWPSDRPWVPLSSDCRLLQGRHARAGGLASGNTPAERVEGLYDAAPSDDRCAAQLTRLCWLLVCGRAGLRGSTTQQASRRTTAITPARAYAEALDAVLRRRLLRGRAAAAQRAQRVPLQPLCRAGRSAGRRLRFKDGKYPEAIEAYNQFVRYRPSHPEVPYARSWRRRRTTSSPVGVVALAARVRARPALRPGEPAALAPFRARLPERSAGSARPAAWRPNARHLLAAHEFYVANFYFDR